MPPWAKALTLTDAVSTMDTLGPVSSICDRATCLAWSWAMIARSREGNCDATPCAVNCEVGTLLPEIWTWAANAKDIKRESKNRENVDERIVNMGFGSFRDKKDRVRTRCECPINGVDNPRQESLLKLRVANDGSTNN